MKNINTKDLEIVSLVVLTLIVIIFASAEDFVKDNKKTFIKVLLVAVFLSIGSC